MNNYIKITANKYDDRLMAFMSLLPFESFEDLGQDGMIAYIPEDQMTEDVRTQMKEYMNQFDTSYEEEVIYPKNWNEEWESNFKPVEVDQFCRIRADFHPPDGGFEHEIVINPKMAFGTGHHETTYMMINTMQIFDLKGKQVFDFGCGTGVLAILASKLGAKEVTAIDIEEESYLNTIENCEVNGISNVSSQCGEIELVNGQKFDTILANINRRVLLETPDQLFQLLKDNGNLLLSGILEEDKEIVLSSYEESGFATKEVQQRGKWLCIHLSK